MAFCTYAYDGIDNITISVYNDVEGLDTSNIICVPKRQIVVINCCGAEVFVHNCKTHC